MRSSTALVVSVAALVSSSPVQAAHAIAPRFCGTLKVLSFTAELHAEGRLSCRRARAVMRAANRLPPEGNVPIGSPPGFECFRGGPAGLTMLGCERASRTTDVVDAIPAPTGPRHRKRTCDPPGELYASYGLGRIVSRGVPCSTAVNALWFWLQEVPLGRAAVNHPTGWRCRINTSSEPASGRDYRCHRGVRRMDFNVGGG